MRFALLCVVAILLASTVPVSAMQRSVAPPGPQLHLHRDSFDARATTGDVPTAALATTASDPYAIIQFHGPITTDDRSALEATGVEILEYIPDFAYLVRGRAAQLRAAERLPQVYARAPFTAADKLAPSLLNALARGERDLGAVEVFGWPDEMNLLARDLSRLSLDTDNALDQREVLQLANLPSVRWIEPIGQPFLLNTSARTIMNVDSAAWKRQNLYGSGQIVAVADSGLDTGNARTVSRDFAGRVVEMYAVSPGGSAVDNNGHGTHVAGSILGSGVQSGADPAKRQYSDSFAGVAPEARLVVQSFTVNSSGGIIGLDPDYYKLFEEAYKRGARLHNNSWGDYTGTTSDPQNEFGGYPYGAQRTDKFVWDNPDMAIFVAAGNTAFDGTRSTSGFCSGGNGVIDPDSLLSPGTAKNVITVGASEGLLTSGGLSDAQWQDFSACYGVEPIASDPISDNPDGMAAFSSRGPTDDGRMKPDLVAPGTNIISNRSSRADEQALWGAYESSDDYSYSGGTSMATPLATGAGTLVREWLVKQGNRNPSAAAVKATLLNTTYDMAPGQYKPPELQEIPFARPNHVAGWGRVDLAFLEAKAPYAIWIDDRTTGLKTNDVVQYTHNATRSLEVTSREQPLRVMLVWTDPPASSSATRQLVNDLDLEVIGPNGTVYRGNGGTTADRINNVEGVIIDTPALGRYQVRVRGYNVPTETQPYALVVAGPIAGGSTTPPDETGTLALTKRAQPTTDVAPGDRITYTLELTVGNRPVRGAQMSDTLPANTAFVSASGTVRRSGNTVTWPLGDLRAGQRVTRTLTVRVLPNTPANSRITNADYQASAQNAPVVRGAAVRVSVKAPAAPARSRFYMPYLVLPR